jgi:hypothetical protein
VKWVSCLVPKIDAPSRIGSTCLVDMCTINKLENDQDSCALVRWA